MVKRHLADCTFDLSRTNATMHIIDERHGVVQSADRRRKVAIVAAGYGREYAPYDDPAWEVWALNAVPPIDSHGRLRADRWFEMHQMSAQSEADLRWIRRCPFPLYLVPAAADHVFKMRKHGFAAGEVDIPTAVRYPIEAVEHAYGGYWACTFAYQIALALKDGFTDIGLFGVEVMMGTMRERTVEWANVSFWIGLAQGLGVTIHLPPQSRLGRHHYRYGIEYDDEKADVERYMAQMATADAVGMGG